jgi:hypothetical protein
MSTGPDEEVGSGVGVDEAVGSAEPAVVGVGVAWTRRVAARSPFVTRTPSSFRFDGLSEGFDTADPPPRPRRAGADDHDGDERDDHASHDPGAGLLGVHLLGLSRTAARECEGVGTFGVSSLDIVPLGSWGPAIPMSGRQRRGAARFDASQAG